MTGLLTAALLVGGLYVATRIFDDPGHALLSAPLFGGLGVLLLLLERPVAGAVALLIGFVLGFFGGIGTLVEDDWADA